MSKRLTDEVVEALEIAADDWTQTSGRNCRVFRLVNRLCLYGHWGLFNFHPLDRRYVRTSKRGLAVLKQRRAGS